VEKMRTIESDVSPCFSRQELDLVMEIAGINEEGAMRALILRSELAKLRHDGFNHPEAINELARRMKRLAGSKRRISLSLTEGALTENKHRRREFTPVTNPLSISRVSFTQLDATADALPRSSLEVPNSRKRLQDALMMDEESWGLRKRPRFFEKDISDSEDSDDVPLDSELYHFDDVGEFSQDEDNDEEEDGDDLLGVTSLDDIPLFTTFSNDYPSSDEEHRAGEEYEELRSNREESDSDDAWAPLTTTSTTSTTSTTTSSTAPTTTTTSTTSTSASAFTASTLAATPSTISTPAPTTTATPTTTTRTPRVPKSTKHRDSLATSFSHRTVS